MLKNGMQNYSSTYPIYLRHSCRTLRCGVFASALIILLASTPAHAKNPESAADQEAYIQSLIDELGSEQYSTRIEASTQLQRIGVPALDQLRSATSHSDPQISATARYLLHSGISWSNESDSPQVKKILQGYATASLMERALKLDQLAELSEDEGIQALARIVRFEPYGDLNKRAALLLLQMPENYLELDAIQLRWSQIMTVVGQSNNDACLWLRKQAEFYESAMAASAAPPDLSALLSQIKLQKPLEDFDYVRPPFGLLKLEQYKLNLPKDSFDTEWWTDQIAKQKEVLESLDGETSSDTIEKLCRFCVELLVRSGNREDAIEFAAQLPTASLSGPDGYSIIDERASWAIDFAMPEIAIEIYENNPDLVASQAALRYRFAEAYRWQGNEAKATEIVSQITSRLASPWEVLEQAGRLTERGQHDWAKAAFESALSKFVATDEVRVLAALQFSESLQDGGDWPAAVQLWEPIIKLIDEDLKYRQRVDGLLSRYPTALNIELLRSRYHQAKAMAALSDKKLEAAKEHFRESIKYSPDNVDAAIEMYRLDGNAEWKKEVDDTIKSVLEILMTETKALEGDFRLASSDEMARIRKRYANSLNTYAWMLANIDRDLPLALQTSQLSNKLARDQSAYIDTLARCFYESGDLKSAIYWQERAYNLEPSQRQLLRTLLNYRRERDELN